MVNQQRREFVAGMGKGMLLVAAAGLVPHVAADSLFDLESKPLHFGNLESLASLMQETKADDLLPKLIKEIDNGTSYHSLIAAASLANARCFGGEDYIGYHAAMALVPALESTSFVSGGDQSLAILKVLHRNTKRMNEHGGRRGEVLKTIEATPIRGNLRRTILLGDTQKAERVFLNCKSQDKASALEGLLPSIRDNIDVHQVVLAYRSFDLIRLTGPAHAHTLLRQNVRQCVDRERRRIRQHRPIDSLRDLLPQLMQDGQLNTRRAGTKRMDDAWIKKRAKDFACESRDQAARIMASDLAKGVHREDLGECLSYAAVTLLLHDRGRESAQSGKPKGSVHGASLGVHACDSAQAWRGIARFCDDMNANASLIAGAWHTAGRGGSIADRPCYDGVLDKVKMMKPEKFPPAMVQALKTGHQPRAAAIALCWLDKGHPAQDLFALLLNHMLPCDGALHHEKFFATAADGYRTSPKAYRCRWLAALARVAASGTGFTSKGFQIARELLPA